MRSRLFTVFLFVILSSCWPNERVIAGDPKFDSIVLDFGGPEIYGGEPTVWISRNRSYSAVIDAAKAGLIETRFEFRVSESEIREIQFEAEILLKEGRKKLRNPVFGEFIVGVFVTAANGKTECIEKPNNEPWEAFDRVRDHLLQLHDRVQKNQAPIYKAKVKDLMWTPPGFLTFPQRQRLRGEERKISKNFQ